MAGSLEDWEAFFGEDYRGGWEDEPVTVETARAVLRLR
jgi:hypothetical protein